MSINKVNPDGSLSRIAGRGTVEYGASTVRTGTVNPSAQPSDDWTSLEVTFSSPMPDTDYYILLTQRENPVHSFAVLAKTVNGFRLGYRNVALSATSQTYPIEYVAFKLHSVEGLEELENDVNDIQSGLTPQSITGITFEPSSGMTMTLDSVSCTRSGNVVSVTGMFRNITGYAIVDTAKIIGTFSGLPAPINRTDYVTMAWGSSGGTVKDAPFRLSLNPNLSLQQGESQMLASFESTISFWFTFTYITNE